MNTEKQTSITNERPRHSRRIVESLAAVATAGVAIATFNTLSDNEAPQPTYSYTELARDSANTSLQEDDKILIDGIKLDPNDSDKNSGSEAVLNSEKVQLFMKENPDEAAAIKSSAFNLPAVGEYAIVERDINGDGEGDAIAVPVMSDKE